MDILPLWAWLLFYVLVFIMLIADLKMFGKKGEHEVSIKEALKMTFVWIGVSLVFCAGIYFLYPVEPHEKAMEFLAGYLIEKSLSMDNLFVFLMLFSFFGVERKYQHEVLFWGIFGAIVLRFIFIFALAGLISQFAWLLAVFGVILIYSGVKMFLDKGDEQMDTENHPIVKFASKHFPVTAKSHGHDFFVRQQVVETSSHQDGSKSRSLEVSKSKLMMTPLFLVLLVIEFSDIIFAVDSIPAVFSVTQNPVIVYTSNIFAIMGLRSLFFLLSDVADRFWMLHYGLGVLLTFIGVKMICGEFFDWHIPTLASLAVILGILVLSILLSVLIKKPQRLEM